MSSDTWIVVIERRASGMMSFDKPGVKEMQMTVFLRKHSRPHRKYPRRFWSVVYEANGRTVIVANLVKNHRKAVNAYMRLVKTYELAEEQWKV